MKTLASNRANKSRVHNNNRICVFRRSSDEIFETISMKYVVVRRSSEEILEEHIKEMRQQMLERDDLINRLHEEMRDLKDDHKSSVHRVYTPL